MAAMASLIHVWVMVDHTPLTNMKDLMWCDVKMWFCTFLSVSLAYQGFLFCQKHLEEAFCYIIFTDSHPFNEAFIFSGKSHCCNGTFADVLFTLLLAKNV